MSAVVRAAAGAVRFELALYRCLLRWIARRPDVPPGSRPVGYGQLSGPMLWLWIFGSATEVVVVEVVLRSIEQPWAHAVRVPLLVLGVWGVVWMLGLLAAMRVRPHLLTPTTLVIRGGAHTRVEVPLDEVAGSRIIEHQVPGLIRTLHLEGDLLLVGVGSRTNLELDLVGTATLVTATGSLVASRVGLWVDDPQAVAAAVRASRSRMA